MARGAARDTPAWWALSKEVAAGNTGQLGSDTCAYDRGSVEDASRQETQIGNANDRIVGVFALTANGDRIPFRKEAWHESDILQHLQPGSHPQAPNNAKSRKPSKSVLVKQSPQHRRQLSSQAHELIEKSITYHTGHSARQSKAKNHVESRSKLPARKPPGVKRSRSAAHLDPDDGHPSSYTTVETRSFYVADLPALIEYFTARFRELTVGPCRKIFTEWIMLAEPDRRKMLGRGIDGSRNPRHRYHERKPSEFPDGGHPSWWPPSVPYKEPSHLRREDMYPLGVVLLLLHRHSDSEGNLRVNWVEKLKKAAHHYVETCPIKSYSSTTSVVYGAAMKKRALEEIFPDLFFVAQRYEDHVAQYGLYDGMVHDDLYAKTGLRHTWVPASNRPRPPSQKRPRHIRGSTRTRSRSVSTDDISESDPRINRDEEGTYSPPIETHCTNSTPSVARSSLSTLKVQENFVEQSAQAPETTTQAVVQSITPSASTSGTHFGPPSIPPHTVAMSPLSFTSSMNTLRISRSNESEVDIDPSLDMSSVPRNGPSQSAVSYGGSHWTTGQYNPPPGSVVDGHYQQALQTYTYLGSPSHPDPLQNLDFPTTGYPTSTNGMVTYVGPSPQYILCTSYDDYMDGKPVISIGNPSSKALPTSLATETSSRTGLDFNSAMGNGFNGLPY